MFTFDSILVHNTLTQQDYKVSKMTFKSSPNEEDMLDFHWLMSGLNLRPCDTKT